MQPWHVRVKSLYRSSTHNVAVLVILAPAPAMRFIPTTTRVLLTHFRRQCYSGVYMPPQAESILEMFRSTGAYLQGHFRLTSGLHSSEYLQCALVLQHPAAAEKLGRLLAEEIRRMTTERIDLVVSPALGGLIIGHEVARALGTPFLFTERDTATQKMALRRGFTVGSGQTAVVIEDVITTGGSTRDVVEVLRGAGVQVVAAGSIIDRSGGQANVDVPRVALVTMQVAAHYPDQCPMCKQGIPAIKPGSRPA
jgi:orotate phosphoribosyltransferase